MGFAFEGWFSLGVELVRALEHELVHGVEDGAKKTAECLGHVCKKVEGLEERIVGAAVNEGLHIGVTYLVNHAGPDSKYAGRPPQDVLRDEARAKVAK